MDVGQIVINQITGLLVLDGLVIWYMIHGKSKWHYMMRQNRTKDMQKIIGMLILVGYALFVGLLSATMMQGNSGGILPEFMPNMMQKYSQGY